MNLDNLKQRPGISILLLYLPFILFAFIEPLYWMNSRPVNGGQFYIALVVIGILFSAPLILSIILLVKWAKSSFMVKIAMFFLLAYGCSMLRISIVQSRKTVHLKTQGKEVYAELLEISEIGRLTRLEYKYTYEGKTYYKAIDDWSYNYKNKIDNIIALKVSKEDPRINMKLD